MSVLVVPEASDMNFHHVEHTGHEVAADPHGVAAFAAAIMAGVSSIAGGRSVEEQSAPVGVPDLSGGQFLA